MSSRSGEAGYLRTAISVYSTLLFYLHEVDNGESVGDAWSRVGHHEVEPLCVFLGVQIRPQPQLVLMLTSVNVAVETYHYCLSRQLLRYTVSSTGCAPLLQCLGRLSLPPFVGR